MCSAVQIRTCNVGSADILYAQADIQSHDVIRLRYINVRSIDRAQSTACVTQSSY